MSADGEHDPATAPPVLGYATPDADGLPPFDAEAEMLIDAGRHPKKLRPIFGGAERAVKYYAKSLARRHDVASVGNACRVCGQFNADTAAEAFWTARLRPSFLEFRWSTSEPSATFKTLHAICPNCWGAWMRKQLRYGLITQLFFWINFIAWLGLIVGPIVLNRIAGARRSGVLTRYQMIALFATLLIVAVLRTIVGWRFRRVSLRNVIQALPKYVAFGGLGDLVSIDRTRDPPAVVPYED